MKQDVDPQLLVNIIQRICKITGDQEAQDRMNCARTSVGKPNDELRGYNGLVDCIGKAAADRISERVATYCGRQAGKTYTGKNLLQISYLVSFSDIIEANVEWFKRFSADLKCNYLLIY